MGATGVSGWGAGLPPHASETSGSVKATTPSAPNERVPRLVDGWSDGAPLTKSVFVNRITTGGYRSLDPVTIPKMLNTKRNDEEPQSSELLVAAVSPR
jgi:hypothetical protein